MKFINPSKMNSPSPLKRENVFLSRHSSMASHGRGAPPETFDMQRKPELVRTRGGVLDVPWKLKLFMSGCNELQKQQKLTKLLLNVNIQNGLGPVQVVMLPENTVEDLMKVAIDVYVKEKRRPLLACADPRCFELHYSQFSLESLKRDEKLMNLGSRNFFLCPKPSNAAAAKSFCYDEVKAVAQFPFPSTNFMVFLL